MTDTIGTGCGIFPFIFHGWMDPACQWHDAAYTEGSWHQQNMTRKEVDDHFLEQCLYLADGVPHKVMQAYLCYEVVRALGWLWWEGDLDEDDRIRFAGDGQLTLAHKDDKKDCSGRNGSRLIRQADIRRSLEGLKCPLKDWKVSSGPDTPLVVYDPRNLPDKKD